MSVDSSVLAPPQRRFRLSLRRGTPDGLPGTPVKPPRLLLRFGLYAGVALVLTAVLGTLLARHAATVRAERDVYQDARFTADRLGRDDIAKLALKRPADDTILPDLDELFGRVALERGVIRVTLFSRNGTVTYSTDHSLIGKAPYDIDLVTQALRGKEVHRTAQLRGGFGDNPTVIQSYAPVYWYFDKNSSPNGVVGVYRDYGPVASSIRAETLLRGATLTGALLFLYVLSFPILRGVTRTLQTRNRQLAQQADALRASEEQYRLIVETASEGVALLDAEGRIVFANGKLAQMVGRADLSGVDFVQLLDGHTRAAADPRWFRRRQEQGEFELLHSDGSIVHVLVSANPIFDQESRYTGTLTMVMDISERKRAEEALHEMEERLGASPAAQDVRPAASMARDFDRALTAITGYSEYLMNRLDGSDSLHREAEQLRRSAQGAVGLTRQLLAISRRESLRTTLIDLSAVVAELAPTLPRMIGEGVEVAVACERDLWHVQADRAQIEQVIVNVALHGRQLMPDGGRLTIETKNVLLDEAFAAAHPPMKPGRYVLLSFTDTGQLVGEEERRRLFDPLFSGAGQDGSGLGLATVYGIVKQNDGFVWATDGPEGRGTTFSIYMPRVDA